MVTVPIATGRTPAELRAMARRERDGRVGARLLALADASDGVSRAEAARAAGMDRQTLRDWVHRYNAEGAAGLRDRPRPGRPCALGEGRQAALKALVLKGGPSSSATAAWPGAPAACAPWSSAASGCATARPGSGGFCVGST